MPVLPAVASTTRPPGLSSPRFSASRIIHLPARSFTDWPGFMNSALPRMVQPVASEACRNLISGVLPIASTTSLLMVIFGESSPVLRKSGATLERTAQKWKAFALRRNLPGFGENHLTHVDISRQESRLAIGEVIFPEPPEAVVET